MKQILVINPGSTSTKIAWYHDDAVQWIRNIEHEAQVLQQYKVIYDQLPMRTALVKKTVEEKGCRLQDLAVIMARGGLLPPVSSGAYRVTPDMIDVLRERPVNHHASNLGAAIAYEIACEQKIQAYIYDPVTVDEMIDLVRITGLKGVLRHGQGHNLNMRAAALRLCAQEGLPYKSANIIVAHLGGGITLSLHSNGRIVDMISDDEGAFSPERAGAIPTYRLVQKMEAEQLSGTQMMKKLQREGGLVSHFGTSDSRVVEKMALEEHNQQAKLVFDAMALSVARCIAKLAVVVNGAVTRIVLTGGIAHSQYFTAAIEERVKFIAAVTVLPGENEMDALAQGGLRVLNGEEDAKEFHA